MKRGPVMSIWTIQRKRLHPFVVYVVKVDSLQAITLLREGKIQYASRSRQRTAAVCASMTAALGAVA